MTTRKVLGFVALACFLAACLLVVGAGFADDGDSRYCTVRHERSISGMVHHASAVAHGVMRELGGFVHGSGDSHTHSREAS